MASNVWQLLYVLEWLHAEYSRFQLSACGFFDEVHGVTID